MSTALSEFHFAGTALRVQSQDGEPWFVAADVCRVLEIANPSDALKRLDDDDRMTLSTTEGHPGRRRVHRAEAGKGTQQEAMLFAVA